MEFDGTEYNKEHFEQVDHRTETNIDEQTMVDGLESELVNELMKLNPVVLDTNQQIVGLISCLIDAKIKLRERRMKPEIKINMKKIEIETIDEVIDSTLDLVPLEELPAFLPLTEFTPEEFDLIRNGDRFNVNGKTMHVRFEKEHIPGLRSLKVIKGID